MGVRVLAAGDGNGDGYGEVAVGAWQETVSAESSTGRVEIFFGAADGLADSSFREWTGSGEDDEFGYSLSLDGDFDGDGRADLAVGLPGWDSTGAVWVFTSNGSGPARLPRHVPGLRHLLGG